MINSVLILVVSVWVFHLNVQYIKGLLRLGDMIEVTQGGVGGRILGRDVFAKWGDIVEMNIATNYWDGACFIISLQAGGKIIFTDIITDALSAYNRIHERFLAQGTTRQIQ